MDSLSLKIVTPQGPVADSLRVKSVSVPGVCGEIGILPNHTPLVTALKPGLVEYAPESGKPVVGFASGGYVDVTSESLTLILDVLEFPDHVDFERARAAEKRAVERLESSSSMDIDIARALASLDRARARLQLERM